MVDALTNFTSAMMGQMNNPQCNILSGMISGMGLSYQGIIVLMVIYFVFKTVDILAFEPLANWFRTRFQKKKEANA